MSQPKPIPFARRQEASLRRAVFVSIGFPTGSLRDAARRDLTYHAADLGRGDGPVLRSALAKAFFVRRPLGGMLVAVYDAAVLPDHYVIAEWELRNGPTRARRIVVRRDEWKPILRALYWETFYRLWGAEAEDGTEPDRAA
jgi:hypothetical protein